MVHSKARPKLFPEQNYDTIMQWIGRGQYQIVDQHKYLPEGILSEQFAWDPSNFVLAASGATTCDYFFLLHLQNKARRSKRYAKYRCPKQF